MPHDGSPVLLQPTAAAAAGTATTANFRFALPLPHLSPTAACRQSVHAVVRVLSTPAQLFPVLALVLLLLLLGSWTPWAQGTASLNGVSNASMLRLSSSG
ncbi:hypothetical protein NDU88_006248 [Pleurodeles waltl]|uniref:Uncharacterized protein n=1 Tax=Pleurodeles waltl TaxID=8319 RepID=A0AAV7TDR1_PLEWA|nr:hypothetical protein NDU88_006248 [Pleurodeles waltl]